MSASQFLCTLAINLTIESTTFSIVMAANPESRGNLHRKLAELAVWTRLRQETALEPELPIIDPHHHLWDDDCGRYMMDELLADTRSGHNIVATVYVETGLHDEPDNR